MQYDPIWYKTTRSTHSILAVPVETEVYSVDTRKTLMKNGLGDDNSEGQRVKDDDDEDDEDDDDDDNVKWRG